MIVHAIMFTLLAACVYWLFSSILDNPGMASITWGTLGIELKTATLIIGLAILFLIVHFSLNFFYALLVFKRQFKLKKDNLSLAKGLVQLTEGNWSKAEKLLLNGCSNSKISSIHYLAAARAAHMQDAFERRDEWLQKAVQSDKKAQFAVGVSQAEMQLSSNQLEQAHLTLIALRRIAPKHPYVLKLFRRVLYRRESWSELLDLLPEITRQQAIKTEDMQETQQRALLGLLQQQAQEGGVKQLQTAWNRLPTIVREQKEAMNVYAKLLYQADDHAACAQFILTSLNKGWNDQLADLYGIIQHQQISQVIQHAERWKEAQQNNPTMLLMMARLYKQQQLWGIAKNYYEASLNQSPNATAYLELAELLSLMNEPQNAQYCYQVGLRYSIRKKAERLNLAPSKTANVANT